MAKVAFIGLGVMGYPMAGHLKNKGGHDVTVFNRTEKKAKAWADEHGGNHKATPREAADGAEFVFMCVGNDDDVRSVVYGDDGIFAGMTAGATLIDNTTDSAELARELAKACSDKGFKFIDAPVSGGQAGAENGALTVMCGGAEADFAVAKPIIEPFAKMVGLMGEAGAGQLTKMMNQICIAGLVQGLSEAIAFGQKSGLDIEKVVGVISKGAAGSWQMENRHKTMDRRRIRARLRHRMDAQGPRHLPGRSQAQWREPAGHRPRRPVLRRGRGDGRQALGHLGASGAAEPVKPGQGQRRVRRSIEGLAFRFRYRCQGLQFIGFRQSPRGSLSSTM